MKLSLVFTATLLSSVLAAPQARSKCGACDQFNKYNADEKNRCTPQWNDLLAKCKATGCQQWIRDPAADCKSCSNPRVAAVCQRFNSLPASTKCSPQWFDALKKCQATGCVKWIRDPAADCQGCKNPQVAAVCDRFQKFPSWKKCSREWFDALEKCKKTGCIQWIRDPADDCKKRTPVDQCKKPDAPCTKFDKIPESKKCSPEWLEALELCKKSGCRQWVRDPAADCLPVDHCKMKDGPCMLFDAIPASKKCTPEWLDALEKCKASNCRQWIRDPAADCKATPPGPLPCDDPKHPCNYYKTSCKKCSAEWRENVIKCKASGCIQWIQDPLNECPATY